MRLELRLTAMMFALLCALARPALPAVSAGAVARVYWTAPGDDSLLGRATAYDVRYALTPITAATFTQATRVLGVPLPKTAGSAETLAVSNLLAGTPYFLAIKTGDDAGNWSGISNIVGLTIPTTAVHSPAAFWFSTPWPNPAHGAAYWSLGLPDAGPLRIDVYDVSGRQVARIASGWSEAGQYDSAWDLRDTAGHSVAAGIYLIRATYGATTVTKRIVVTP